MIDTTEIKNMGFDDPAIWRKVVRVMEEMEQLVWNDPLIKDNLTRAEGARYLTRLISSATEMAIELWTPDYPQFLTFLNTRIHWGLPATDCHYQWAPVHGDNVYRISGDRGTARVFDIETRTGHFAHIADWALVDRLTDAKVGPNNHVDIILSRERPEGVENWIQLAEGPGNIIYRQYYYDWNTEQPARLSIVNENAIYPPPALQESDIADKLALFCDWLQQVPERFSQVVNTYYTAPANSMIFDTIDFGWKSLKYGKGIYECGPDEAIILEVKLPKSYYWSIQLCSHFWEARDYHLRQTSLNGHQAEVDDEGVFRAVISHRDPGIANWLDAGGHEQGLLAIRYYEPDSTPIPTMRRVKLSELDGLLPDSARRVSAEERQKTLRDRAWSVARLGRE
ncbi:MAG: DUF1214 domain-containing protein [Porticoccaceae bacterium]|nr:DUF1214 domain-containing protein [Pseudomonadales bacterium]MCP5172940.1 DUF1214 domain-containing protein [Pseudomonadales bacterium]MCP5302413.1 DUF1214 domain-containing protein [Pseudomonadales bacterium]